jgi:hypothetical protein
MGSKLNWFTAGVVAGLTAAAIGQELAKPRGERTWKGHVAGVPYSFRFGEWPDVANEYWNPDSDKIFTEHVIGLGWGVNFAALARYGRTLLGERDAASARRPAPSAETASPPGHAAAPVGE